MSKVYYLENSEIQVFKGSYKMENCTQDDVGMMMCGANRMRVEKLASIFTSLVDKTSLSPHVPYM